MVGPFDPQLTSNSLLQQALRPRNWQESLVSRALNPQASKTARFLHLIGLCALGGLFTLATFGIGYFLVGRVHTSYTKYQQRINKAMAAIAQENLCVSAHAAPSAFHKDSRK